MPKIIVMKFYIFFKNCRESPPVYEIKQSLNELYHNSNYFDGLFSLKIN